jgi:hypothetical protein
MSFAKHSVFALVPEQPPSVFRIVQKKVAAEIQIVEMTQSCAASRHERERPNSARDSHCMNAEQISMKGKIKVR